MFIKPNILSFLVHSEIFSKFNLFIFINLCKRWLKYTTALDTTAQEYVPEYALQKKTYAN